MKILVVFCHPHRDSLTGALADVFVEGALAAGHEIEFADLSMARTSIRACARSTSPIETTSARSIPPRCWPR